MGQNMFCWALVFLAPFFAFTTFPPIGFFLRPQLPCNLYLICIVTIAVMVDMDFVCLNRLHKSANKEPNNNNNNNYCCVHRNHNDCIDGTS